PMFTNHDPVICRLTDMHDNVFCVRQFQRRCVSMLSNALKGVVDSVIFRFQRKTIPSSRSSTAVIV
ncbi:MAG: hypothetical protein ACKPKO_37305, partial [Candidatus Fonsibacter sp.]